MYPDLHHIAILRVVELDLRFRGGLGLSPIGLENFRVGLEIFWPPSGNEGVWRGRNQRGRSHEFEKYINKHFLESDDDSYLFI